MVTQIHTPVPRFVLALTVVLLVSFSSSSVWAFGSESSSDEDLEEAQEAIDAESYEDAVDLLRSVLEEDPDNADAYNFLAYSQRSMEQFDVAMENYKRALEIDPEHKGALEYQGELFLQLGDQAAAEANLARLGELCPRGCQEHEELQAAIERFKDGDLTWAPPARLRARGE